MTNLYAIYIIMLKVHPLLLARSKDGLVVPSTDTVATLQCHRDLLDEIGP